MSPVSDVSHAQNLEDVRLWRVLYDCPDKFFVDCGANHPTKFSVTKWFSERGWSGINIEPGPDYLELATARPNEINLNLAIGLTEGFCDLIVPDEATGRASVRPENAYDPNLKQVSPTVSTVRVRQRPLADVLAEHSRQTGISFLSVDVEGAEAEVLASNDWVRFRPRVVIVEAIDPITMLSNYQNWEPILLENGYHYAVSDGLNRFYVAQEHPELFARFDYDFTGQLLNSSLSDYAILAKNNLDLIQSLSATRNSWSFRIGTAALKPLKPLRPLKRKAQKWAKSRSKNVHKIYRTYTATGQPLQSVKAPRPLMWADCPDSTPHLNDIRQYFTSRYDQPAQPTTPDEVNWIRDLAKDNSQPNSIGYFAQQFIDLSDLPEPSAPSKAAKAGCVLLDLRALQIMDRENIKVGMLSAGAQLVKEVTKEIKASGRADTLVIGLVDTSPISISSYLTKGLDQTVYPSELGSIEEIALALDPLVVTVGKWAPLSGPLLKLIPRDTPSAGFWWDNTITRFKDYCAHDIATAMEFIALYENYSKYNYILTLTRAAESDGVPLFSDSAVVFRIGTSSPVLRHAELPVITKPARSPILLMGNGMPHKNLAAGVCAFASLRQDDLTLIVLALMSPEQKDALMNLATDLGLAENQIQFESQVAPERHLELLTQSCVLIAPSLAEGFDLPTVEAIHCGTPVVGSSIAVHEELIGPGWWLVNAEDPMALGQALERALKDPAALVSAQRELLRKRWWPTQLEEEVKKFLDCALGIKNI